MTLATSFHSPINSLSADQRELIETWLFDKKISYYKVADRCLAEFQIKVGATTLRRHFRQAYRRRNIARIEASVQQADAVVQTLSENPEEAVKTLLKIGGQLTFQKALNCQDVNEFGVVGDFIKLLLTVQREEIHQKKFQFDREKWEFDAARACEQHAAEIQSILANTTLDESARLTAIRQRLFGQNLPV